MRLQAPDLAKFTASDMPARAAAVEHILGKVIAGHSDLSEF